VWSNPYNSAVNDVFLKTYVRKVATPYFFPAARLRLPVWRPDVNINPAMVKVVLLDRDGVINAERDDYIKSPAELDVFPYSKKALDRLRGAGHLLYIVSNQSGVGRGLMTEADLEEVTGEIVSAVGPFDGIFYCTHGLLRQALTDAERRGHVSEAWLIGDSPSDIAAGAAVGCRTVLVLTGLNTDYDSDNFSVPPDYIAADLTEAAKVILTGG
jgi:D-glycero-D-manno-heptose 1,7-bisphosphate phosphatase